jgi:hypothetical protein
MDPAIGAALIGLAAAAIGVGGLVFGVHITAERARKEHRWELAVAALTDYMRGTAKTSTADRLQNELLPQYDDDALKLRVSEAAQDLIAEGFELQAESKVRLLAFADEDLLSQLAAWERDGSTGDPKTYGLFVAVVKSLRRGSSVGGEFHDPDARGLLFGWPKADD